MALSQATNPHVLLPCPDDAPQCHDEPEQCRSLGDDDDLGDWEEFEVDDPYAPGMPPLRFISITGMLLPSDSSQAYVFCGEQYTVIKMIPGTMSDAPEPNSKVIVFDWPSLLTTMFAGWIDAVLPIPNSKHMYFFSYEDYALINVDPGTPNDAVIDGPKNIIAQWPSLKSAGFKIIDAILPNPLNTEQAYFFSGDQYALIHVQQGPNKDYIVDGPKPFWPCLKDAGFKVIIMMLPNPSNLREAYVFSSRECALVSISHDPSDNYIVDGPKAIHTVWPSLRQAWFF